jgi:alpha-ketoglutarate-dependent taurine dioxygenase
MVNQEKTMTFDENGLEQVRRVVPDEGSFPALIHPGTGTPDWGSWVAGHRGMLEERLDQHGALLFRGFGMASGSDFQRGALRLCPRLDQNYGDLPKESEGDFIYRSTPYPADRSILFHNEASHTPRWPMRQFFYCVQRSPHGGNTPIVDCRRLYAALDPALRAEFERRQLRYVRNFIDGLDVSWQRFFGTEVRGVVEARCREGGVDYEWREDGGLRISTLCPAVLRHPRTGEPVFFNQVQLHHISCLDAATRDALLELLPEEDLPRNVCYGDGEPIPDDVVDELRRLTCATAVSFDWQEGDVLVLDNMLTAHARKPFSGPRRIMIALGDFTGRQPAMEL